MLFRYSKFTVDNLIHLVLDSAHDLQPTLWYICEYHSWRNSENWPITRPKSSSSSSFSERDDAAKKDLARRERNLEQKEKTLEKKENLLQQKLLQAELREREALEFEQEAKIKLEEVDEKEQELEAEKEKLSLTKNKNKNKNKERFSTSSIPTHHDADNSDDDENPSNNETNNNDNQWLLRFSNLQQRLETAYREIENLRRPVFPAGTTITNEDNDDITNDDNNNNNDNDDSKENSSSTITSLQHELKLTKENAQKQKEENILLRKTMKEAKIFAERNVSSERNVSFLRRRGIRDNLVDDVDDEYEASSVGNRWAPLNFRVERRRRGEEGMGSATTGRREGEEEEEGIVGMIEMQKEFKFLERLR